MYNMLFGHRVLKVSCRFCLDEKCGQVMRRFAPLERHFKAYFIFHAVNDKLAIKNIIKIIKSCEDNIPVASLEIRIIFCIAI